MGELGDGCFGGPCVYVCGFGGPCVYVWLRGSVCVCGLYDCMMIQIAIGLKMHELPTATDRLTYRQFRVCTFTIIHLLYYNCVESNHCTRPNIPVYS